MSNEGNGAGKNGNGRDLPVAVVTGAGRGIGRALLELLLKRNYIVIAVVRSLKDVGELEALSNHVHAVCCDVTEPSSERLIKEFVESKVEKIDLLINNAGYGATAYGIESLKFEELDRVMAVHCHGPIRCVKACLPLIRKSSRAAILNISSRFASLEWVSTRTVPADQATYAYRIAKAAMNMLSSCLAVELQDAGIRVLAIDPGKVKTRFGPVDADTEASQAAESIVNLAENNKDTALFVQASSGEKLPW